MRKLKIIIGTVASGEPLKAGSLADVPGDISAVDADVLVRMGRAEWQEEPEKPAEPLAPVANKPRKKSTRKSRSK